jgi:hypothetical protein
MFIPQLYLAIAILYVFFAGGYASMLFLGWIRGNDPYTPDIAYPIQFIGACICGFAWPIVAIVQSFIRTAQAAVRPPS